MASFLNILFVWDQFFSLTIKFSLRSILSHCKIVWRRFKNQGKLKRTRYVLRTRCVVVLCTTYFVRTLSISIIPFELQQKKKKGILLQQSVFAFHLLRQSYLWGTLKVIKISLKCLIYLASWNNLLSQLSNGLSYFLSIGTFIYLLCNFYWSIFYFLLKDYIWNEIWFFCKSLGLGRHFQDLCKPLIIKIN